MTTTDVEAPRAEDIETLLHEVWQSVLAEPEPLLPSPREATPGPGWAAAVTVSGAWRGMIVVELGEHAGEEVARRMLDLGEEAELEEADVVDAVGEVVNILGGGLKSLMPGPSTLSLPVVSVGRVAVPRSTVATSHVALAWRSYDVAVRVHALADEPGDPHLT